MDIFFVISGYLIGKHLLEDIQSGRFSIRAFYARRARRIFPALVVVLLFIGGAGWVVFSAPEFAALGRQIAAATLFSNNILLWSQSGYFDIAANDKPLLHLWSLGIEEQFYLLVPILLWVSKQGESGSIRWVARLGVLSLLTMIFLGNLEYSATFYLIHTRFWELASGVVLAQAELCMTARAAPGRTRGSALKGNRREILFFSIASVFLGLLQFGMGGKQLGHGALLTYGAAAAVVIVGGAIAIMADLYARPEAWNRFLDWAHRNRTHLATASFVAGLLLCCGSFVALDSVSWPGVRTVIPVLGAVLLIAAGSSGSASNRLLALKPFAFVGAISYPLYLWHWPLLVLWRQLNPETGAAAMAVPLIASFCLAWVTKILVEDPIRFGRLGSATWQRPALSPLVSGMVLTGLLGLAGCCSRRLAVAIFTQIACGRRVGRDQSRRRLESRTLLFLYKHQQRLFKRVHSGQATGGATDAAVG